MRRRPIIIISSVIGILVLTLLIILWRIDRNLQERLALGWFLPPIEFYTAARKIPVDQRWNTDGLKSLAQRLNWRQRAAGQALYPGDFQILSESQCREQIPDLDWPFAFETCVGIYISGEPGPQWAALAEGRLIAAYAADGGERSSFRLPGQRFAQYYQGEPILRTLVDLGQVPLYCAQAVTAIEDSDFLEHRGISLTAIGRAMIRNLSQARFAEGASTITQQLVKNYFLSSEKTIRRKIIEQIMAILLELRVDKDQILANYLNVIYMGQQGSFQVRGFAAASEYYFAMPLDKLELPQCALLAAIINNPGRYQPFKSPERALARRKLVLSRMAQLGMIDEQQMKDADSTPLAVRSSHLLSEPAPYFVQAILKQINELGIADDRGLVIQTTLDPVLQARSQSAVTRQLEGIESRLPKLKTASANGPLQASSISVDFKTGQVKALVGGRSYRVNQFNRVLSSRRQPGSLFKPLVFLAALESGDYNSDSELRDEPWTYKYEGQQWTPRNYDKSFRGVVTFRQALAESLNVPTARLAVDVGLESLLELARRLGIQSPLEKVPALALGAAEVTPLEIATAYSTIADHGRYKPLHLFTEITTLNGETVYEHKSAPEQVVQEAVVDELISILRDTFTIGTAKAFAGAVAEHSPAGKTGTTSDTRDCWFAGFDEQMMTITWVGFDDNTSTGLTGASAALPIWMDIQYSTK